MASMLNRMSLKQKLILFAAIPTVVVLIFGTLRMLTLFERFHVAHTNSTAITITQQIESLIFEVQKERGLSAGYLSSQDNQYQRKLISQREITDSHIAALLDNANLTSLLQWFDNADHNKSLAVKIQRIMLLTQQLTTVRQQVDSKQGNQSFDYYSELNLNLLRFIDQLQIRSIVLPKAKHTTTCCTYCTFKSSLASNADWLIVYCLQNNSSQRLFWQLITLKASYKNRL